MNRACCRLLSIALALIAVHTNADTNIESCDSMQSIQVKGWGGPDVLTVADSAAIPVPSGSDVCVKIFAAGVNPVETYIRAGTYGSAKSPPLPWTPGNDGAGIVERVGPDYAGPFAPGDRVYTAGSVSGTYAQYALCRAGQLQPLPAGVSFAQGAAVGVAYRTAHRALFIRGRARSGAAVLVHGASGGVGLAAVQLAAAHGCRVTGTASTEAGRALVLANGAAAALDHSAEGYLAGHSFDVIVEMLANVNLGKDLKALNRGGVVAVVGNRGAHVGSVDFRDLMNIEGSVVGVLGGTAEEKAQGYAAVNALLARGALSPVVGPTFTLDQAPAAHVEVIEHKAGSAGKIVLLPWGAEAAGL